MPHSFIFAKVPLGLLGARQTAQNDGLPYGKAVLWLHSNHFGAQTMNRAPDLRLDGSQGLMELLRHLGMGKAFIKSQVQDRPLVEVQPAHSGAKTAE